MATNKDLVSSLYIAVYNRAPEASGLNFWSQQLDAGHKTFAQLADDFVKHPVFEQTYAGSNRDTVNKFYENVLGHAGDAAGVDYWTDRLDQGDSVGTVLSNFLSASLTNDLGAMNLTPEENHFAVMRQETLKNKVVVSNYYADLLNESTELSPHVDLGSLSVQNDPSYQAAQVVISNVDHTPGSIEQAIGDITTTAFSKIDFTPFFTGDFGAMGLSNAEFNHIDNLAYAIDLRIFNDDRLDTIKNPGGAYNVFNFDDYIGDLNQLLQASGMVKIMDYLLTPVNLQDFRLNSVDKLHFDHGVLTAGLNFANGMHQDYVVDLLGDDPYDGAIDLII